METITSIPEHIDEQARRRFEDAWVRGCPEPIEKFLPEETAPAHLSTLEELVLIEMEFAWKAWSKTDSNSGGRQPTRVMEYRERFPALDSPETLHRLLTEELGVRQRFGDNPSSNEYAALLATIKQTDSAKAFTFDGLLPTRDDLPHVPGYEVYGLLGRGGMGLVLKARQLSLDRIVALKMILLGSAARQEDVSRLRTEAEAVARLQHPNVMQIYEVAELNGCPYLTLEYANGGSLARWSEGKPQPHRLAARLVATLAQAIHHAHQRGIIHRDLKPANILLQRTEGKATGKDLLCLEESILIPKIGDFGLAKVLGEASARQTQTGAVIGTPCYMAPEQTGGRQQDIGIPTDVYSLGAILYELLTGAPPFRAATALETLELVRSHEPALPRKTQPKVPLDLETICLTCLEKEPAKRYASALALADDLHRFLAGESIAARPATRREQFLKWARRHPARAALIAVSVAAAATLVIVVLVDNVRLQRQRDIADANQQKAEEQRQLAVTHLREARSAVDGLLTRVGFERLNAVPYMETVRLEVLKDALQFYEGIAKKESDDPDVRLETGKAWRRLGKIHEELSDRSEAVRCFRSARDIVKQLQTQSPSNEAVLIELAACENNLGNSLMQTNNDHAESRQAIVNALELQEKLRGAHPTDVAIVQNLAETYDILAQSFNQSGQIEEAEDAFRRALTTLESVATKSPKPQAFDLSLASRKRNPERISCAAWPPTRSGTDLPKRSPVLGNIGRRNSNRAAVSGKRRRRRLQLVQFFARHRQTEGCRSSNTPCSCPPAALGRRISEGPR